MSGPTEKFEVGKSFRDSKHTNVKSLSLIFCKRVCPTSYNGFLITTLFSLFLSMIKKQVFCVSASAHPTAF
jgi:hypothetical protein